MIKKNDLCFFGKNIQNITHVGLYIGKNKLLHAFEKVRIDKINKKGIFNSDSLKITHNLISIRRIN
jgi:cell wall-associated NlpC family hydrolase